MTRTDSTTTNIGTCCPPSLLINSAIAQDQGGLSRLYAVNNTSFESRVSPLVNKAKSIYGAIIEEIRDDLYKSDLQEKLAIVQAPSQIASTQSSFNVAKTFKINRWTSGIDLNLKNLAILKLLDQWTQEPQIGDDEWWNKFDEELKEIRKSGWQKN